MKISFNLLITLIFTFFFSKTLLAETRCGNFYNQIKNSEVSPELFEKPRTSINTIGFGIASTWDNTADDNYGDWKVDLNSEGYPKVGKLLTTNIIEKKVSVGDIILEVNGTDIRNYNFDGSIFFSDLFKDNKNSFKLKKPNGEIYKIDTQKQNITPEKYIYDIYFDYINIDDKTGSFDVTLKMDFVGSLDEEKLLFKIAKEIFYTK